MQVWTAPIWRGGSVVALAGSARVRPFAAFAAHRVIARAAAMTTAAPVQWKAVG